MSKEQSVDEIRKDLSDALRGQRKDLDKRDDALVGGEFREYDIIEKSKSKGKKNAKS